MLSCQAMNPPTRRVSQSSAAFLLLLSAITTEIIGVSKHQQESIQESPVAAQLSAYHSLTHCIHACVNPAGMYEA